MQPRIFELDSRALEEPTRRRGDQHLARTRQREHPRSRVHRDAAHVIADELDLAGVQADPDLDAERPDGPRHLRGAPGRAGRAVEDGQEPVAGRLHLTPAGMFSCSRRRVLWAASSSRQAASPSSWSRAVESTMSVNRTVASDCACRRGAPP